jgi:hypothetical protein
VTVQTSVHFPDILYGKHLKCRGSIGGRGTRPDRIWAPSSLRSHCVSGALSPAMKRRSYTATRPYVFTWCLSKHRDNLIHFIFYKQQHSGRFSVVKHCSYVCGTSSADGLQDHDNADLSSAVWVLRRRCKAIQHLCVTGRSVSYIAMKVQVSMSVYTDGRI